MKTFKKISFFKKDFLFNQLVQIYSTLLITVIVGLVAVMSIYFSVNHYKKVQYNAEKTMDQLNSSIEQKKAVVSNILYEFTSDTDKFTSMKNYLTQTPKNYFDYTYDYYDQMGREIYFPTILIRLMNSFPEITSIDIVLDSVDYRLHVNKDNKSGIRLFEDIKKTDDFTFIRPITDDISSKSIGMLYVTFDRDNILSMENDFANNDGQENLVVSRGGDILFSAGGGINQKRQTDLVETIREKKKMPENLKKHYFIAIKETSVDSEIIVLQSKYYFFQSLFKEIGLLIIVASGVVFILVYTLHRTFNKYSKQVKQIVDVTNAVSLGNFDQEIEVENVQQELREISSAINQMIKNINTYIHDLYVLEIKQKDAHMNALQAQINPHFMSNTLEYIRMYALSQGQEELADVVYAFSALLRNNVTMETTTTLEQEISFCEKYVFLYQMRFPDKFAYHFTLQTELEKLTIPKFVIQPIIENYFIHGIDYARTDNAISLKAYQNKQMIIIEITDNGQGVSEKKRQNILNQLRKEQQGSITSIGLANIDERLRHYFGKDYHMEIESQQNSFFKVKIIIENLGDRREAL